MLHGPAIVIDCSHALLHGPSFAKRYSLATFLRRFVVVRAHQALIPCIPVLPSVCSMLYCTLNYFPHTQQGQHSTAYRETGRHLHTVYARTIINPLPKLRIPTTFPDTLWLPQTDRQTDSLFYCAHCQWRFVVAANGMAGARIVT